MARLKTFADKAGRDVSEISVSVFGAPGDQATLDSYAEAGVDRAILGLPSAPRDEVMALLDKYAPLAG